MNIYVIKFVKRIMLYFVIISALPYLWIIFWRSWAMKDGPSIIQAREGCMKTSMFRTELQLYSMACH